MIGTRTEVLHGRSSEGLSWATRLAGRVLLANVLLVLCSQIAFPLPWTPVPLTLQTFGVLLIAVFFGARASALAALLYLVEGAAGLPVFQPFGAPGAARLFGPTAGYLLAFPVAAFVAGRLAEILSARAGAGRGIFAWLRIAAALLCSEAIIVVSGWAWLALLLGGGAALTQGVLPFLAGDFLKVAAVATIARSLPAKS
ncbi:MAG TPA: biotin transporter BioY [Candidatus Acidoferrales bacterium]|nr:biotin transporter BioY [Candidatus Acidoferrales bacterium]